MYIVSGYDTVSVNGQSFFRTDSSTLTERVVPTGGNTLLVGNLEAQWPSPIAPKLLQLAVFADAGRLWNRGEDSRAVSLSEEGPKVKITPGLGIRVASPFGAIRIDLGYNGYSLPAGAAYYNAPLQAGVAPLYCVSPGNSLVTLTAGNDGAPPVQASGSCPNSFRPSRGNGFVRRLNPSIWIGQAF